MASRRSALLVCALLALGCGGEGPEAAASDEGQGEPRPTASARPGAGGDPPADSDQGEEDPRPEILFFGTSLTAGYGLEDPEAGFPARIAAMLDSAGLEYRVVEAGVPGETSAAGRRRIGWVLDERPVEIVVVELGANDGLRGQDPEALRRNLEAVVDTVRTRRPRAAVVLAGMEAPPNLGERYTDAFRRVFREVAAAKDTHLIPFLLEGVGGVAELNQEDGIHPDAQGHRRVAENVWEVLEPVARRRAEGPGP